MSVILQAIVVFGVIAIGARYAGIGLGIWGGIGLFLLVTVFGLTPTSAPTDVLLIMIAVATAASVMDAAVVLITWCALPKKSFVQILTALCM